jgi:transcriptional regulator with XRE-family HTH domain
MTGAEIRSLRVAAGIAGTLVSRRARIARSRLSDIERGYVVPREKERAAIKSALEGLIAAKRRLSELADQVGYPVSGL